MAWATFENFIVTTATEKQQVWFALCALTTFFGQ